MAPARKQSESKPASKSSGAYVAVDRLSWRPHPLERGTEVSDILPADLIEELLAEGILTSERPDGE